MSRKTLASLFASVFFATLPHFAAAQIGSSPVQYWEQISADVGLPEQEDAFFGAAVAAGDFDGDGFDELAIGVPEYDVGAATDAGVVVVLYGSWDGPTTAGLTWFAQSHPDLIDSAEEGDHFGGSLAAGDFNGDGFDDLAVGIPYETVEGVDSAGAVQIIYGSITGLTFASDQFIYQGVDGELLGTPEELDRFGFSLTVGNFDGDSYDDLVIGVPYETISAEAGAGAFHVIFGSVSGLTGAGNRLFYLGNGMPRLPDEGDNLGWSLAAGNFIKGSAGDELAVGAPGTDLGAEWQAGTVWILSDVDGTTVATPLDLDDTGMPDDGEFGDFFGCALAAGQFDGGGATDLAIGACRKPVDEHDDAGKVYIHYFGSRPTVAIEQDGLPGEQAETGDFFGNTLASGDFNGDGTDDVAVSSYFESGSTGVVHLLYGIEGTGVTEAGAQTLTQAVNAPETGDRFGQALVAGNFSGHSGSDLAVGAPYEFDAAMEWVGGVNVFYSIALFLDGFEGGDMAKWSLAVGSP